MKETCENCVKYSRCKLHGDVACQEHEWGIDDRPEVNAKIERYKSLINEAKVLYTSLTDEEVEACNAWLDEEFRKESEPRGEDALINATISHT